MESQAIFQAETQDNCFHIELGPRMDKIERVDAVTLERRVLARASPQHPFDLAVYGEFLFYSDWVLHSIVRVNKYTGEEVTWLRKNIPRPMSLIAVGDAVSDCPRLVQSVQSTSVTVTVVRSVKINTVCDCHCIRWFSVKEGTFGYKYLVFTADCP